jgi:hypothetical protein
MATGNAYVTRRHDHELPGRKIIGVLLQHSIQVVDLGLQALSGKPEEQDAGMAKPLVKNQLAEIAVRNDQNLLLLPGDR